MHQASLPKTDVHPVAAVIRPLAEVTEEALVHNFGHSTGTSLILETIKSN